jgi:hypothetical protein
MEWASAMYDDFIAFYHFIRTEIAFVAICDVTPEDVITNSHRRIGRREVHNSHCQCVSGIPLSVHRRNSSAVPRIISLLSSANEVAVPSDCSSLLVSYRLVFQFTTALSSHRQVAHGLRCRSESLHSFLATDMQQRP